MLVDEKLEELRHLLRMKEVEEETSNFDGEGDESVVRVGEWSNDNVQQQGLQESGQLRLVDTPASGGGLDMLPATSQTTLPQPIVSTDQVVNLFTVPQSLGAIEQAVSQVRSPQFLSSSGQSSV